MRTVDELLANRPDTTANWMEPETAEVFRTKGMSYWHWGYCYQGKSYAFYNTAAQAQAARDKRASK